MLCWDGHFALSQHSGHLPKAFCVLWGETQSHDWCPRFLVLYGDGLGLQQQSRRCAQLHPCQAHHQHTIHDILNTRMGW